MNAKNIEILDPTTVATDIRRRVTELTLLNNGCYLSQALSSAEILGTLYGRVLNFERLKSPLKSPPLIGVPNSLTESSPSGGRFHGAKGPDLDRFLISPAHYAVAIYAALEATGRLESGALKTFNTDGSTLEMIGAEHSPGFELTTGSFGQALSQSAGIAFARALRGETGKTVVFVSDGELEEGQTWEGAQAAAMFDLHNLFMVIDVNGQQVDGLTAEIMNIEPIHERFAAFNWNVFRVDGHNPDEIERAFQDGAQQSGPTAIVCDTNSSQGIPYLERYAPKLHYVRPKNDDDVVALEEALARFEKGVK